MIHGPVIFIDGTLLPDPGAGEYICHSLSHLSLPIVIMTTETHPPSFTHIPGIMACIGACAEGWLKISEWAHTQAVDLRRSFIISDQVELITQAGVCGAVGLYILTARGLATLAQLPLEHLVFHRLGEAVSWLAAHPTGWEEFLKELTAAAEIIREGGLVAFPTETVYGLGADALNEQAVARIFEAKSRPLHDPLIVHVCDPQDVPRLTASLPPAFHALIHRFWPGPLTLILPKSSVVPDIVTAGLSTVAVRMPANPWARMLIAYSSTPIAAPSANTFGRTSPTCAGHVREQLGAYCDVIIDGGSCRVGVESTVLSLVTTPPIILRPGGISQEEIEDTVGPVSMYQRSSSASETSMTSPGMFPTHYAPRTPLILVDDIRPYAQRKKAGIITVQKPEMPIAGPVINLSPRGDLREAAANLYRAIRDLDALNLECIVAQQVANMGLGTAINDRLRRAAHQTKISTEGDSPPNSLRS